MPAGGDPLPMGTAPRRVLILIKGLTPGGAERLLLDMLDSADRQRYEYEVAYVLEAADELAPELVASGRTVHPLRAKHDWDLRWLTRLRRLLVQGHYDVVHAHLPYAATMGRLVAATLPARSRPKLVYTEHSMWDKMAVLVRILNRSSLSLNDELIVVSEAARQVLPRRFRKRAHVVIHGVRLPDVTTIVATRDRIRASIRSELAVPNTDLLVLTIANLRPEKGYEVLLAAARQLADSGVPVQFAAAGLGPLEAHVHAEVDRLRLGGRFRLLGYRTDVLELLAAADIFVLPSHHEGLPVVLMEATAVGVPIVASAVGEIPRLLTDGKSGLLVAPGQPAELTGAITRLVDHPDLRRQLAEGATEVSQQFDVDSATRQVEDIYDAVLERP